MAAIAAGIALGLGISLYFGAPEKRSAALEPPAAADGRSSGLPNGTGLPWRTVEGRVAGARVPLPGAASVPPGILDGSPQSDGPQQAALPPATPAPAPAAEPLPAWKKFAIDVPVAPDRPMVAVVIDDLGMDRDGTRRAVRLPPAVTLAFLPYAPDVAAQAAAARAAGHELLVHVSMEPEGPNDSGPNTLEVGLPAPEIRDRLTWALGRFEAYVGINNHMGSRFTADTAGMDVVLAEMRARGLLFLDSRTTRDTVAITAARRFGVPAASRHVFLDDARDREAVLRQLAAFEQRALGRGRAVAIGHPHDVTLAALEVWLPTLEAKGLQLVPISAVVESAAAPDGATARRGDGVTP